MKLVDVARLFAILAVVFGWAGCDCGRRTTYTEPNATQDGGDDAAADASADASTDASADASADGAVDAAVDAATDAGTDAAPDAAPPDAGPEPDAGVDASPGVDAGPEILGCTSCHGEGDEPAPPVDTLGRRDTSLPTVGAHRKHVRAGSMFRTGECSDCHEVPDAIDAPGHIDDAPAELVWSERAAADGVVPDYDGARCTVYCHGVTRAGGELTEPEWTERDQAYCGACHGAPPPLPHPQGVESCGPCHPFQGYVPTDPARHVDGVLDVDPNAAACGACHDLPPETGTHALHAGRAAPVYGGLDTAGSLGVTDAYAFGCGHCHPIDPAHHMNGGRAEIALFDGAAPEGSLKALSGATATYQPGAQVVQDAFGLEYTLGTCADVYCHSGMVTTSGPVAEPDVDFPFVGYPIVYPPYEVTRTREPVTATWGGALGCDGCHGYPPRAEWPSDTGGAGESHSYLDPDAFEDLHVWNHGFDPIPCRTCHVETISTVAAFLRDGTGITTFDPVAIDGFDRHVNGAIDVAFDRVNPLGLYRNVLDVGAAAWDPLSRTCTNVSCHFEQTSVQFGAPYRYANQSECNVCHAY